MVNVLTPSGLDIALERRGGTVTAFLEDLVGEPVDADVQRHLVTEADASNGLRVSVGHPLLVRASDLKGRRSGHTYVHAESTIVLSRLPETFRARLETGRDPIGRILDDEGIAVARVALPDSGTRVLFGSSVPTTVGGHLLHRTYRIDIDGSPVMVITEWFLNSLQRFLPPHNA